MKHIGVYGALIFIVVPLVAWGQLVPCEGAGCTTGHLIQLGNNILKFFVSAAVVIAAIMIAWGGLTMVTAGGDSGKVSKGRALMSNAIIGIIIVLASYLLIDTVMKLIMRDPEAWKSIENAGQSTPTATAPQTGGVTTGTGSGTSGTYSGQVSQCPPGNSACNVDALKSAGFTDEQANVMSCIAMTESSGNPSTPPYNQANPGSNSTACGLFQVTQSTWSDMAGSVSSACKSFSQCQNAACNKQVAVALVEQRGYQPWTCSGCNAKAQACISQYGS